MSSDCVFCQKIENKDAATVIHGRPEVASFEPLNPVTPGHRLFIPLSHVEHGEGIHAAYALSQAVYAASEHAQDMGEDFNLITSSGPAATQTIPHIHIHYVPRRPDDGLALPWKGQVERQATQIERVREARSMINRIITAAEGGVDLGDPATLAKSIVNKLNDALGDTDD